MVHFQLRRIYRSGIELLDGAQQFARAHLLDDFLEMGRQFREEVIADAAFQPVDAMAVVPDLPGGGYAFPGD